MTVHDSSDGLDTSFAVDYEDQVGGTTVPVSQSDDEKIKNEATRLNRNLRLLQVGLLALVVLASIGVGVAAYFSTSAPEQVQFELAFQAQSQKFLEGIALSLSKNLGAMDAFQSHLVSWAQRTNQTWPFVTTPDFALRAEKIRLLSQFKYLAVSPLVTSQQRLQWEGYTLVHQGWVNESMNLQATDKFYYGPIDYEYDNTIEWTVHGDNGVIIPYNTAQVLPTWQASPVVVPRTADGAAITSPFNYDSLFAANSGSDEHRSKAIVETLSRRKAVLTRAYYKRDNEQADLLRNNLLPYLVPSGQDPGEPNSDFYYPIVNYSLDSISVDENDKQASLSVVGMLTATFFWRDIIKDLLPSDAKGIVAVFSNPCSSSSFSGDFTYQLDGTNPTFLGRGDLHELQFNSYGVERNLQEELSTNNDVMFFEKSQYTGIPMDNSGFCPWSVKVYPSTTLHVQYQTSNPMWFTMGAVLIFLLTSVVFLFYGYVVGQLQQQRIQQQQQGGGRTMCNLPGRRERKVMTTAAKSGAIVSSMCPTMKGEQSVFADAHGKDGSADKVTVFKLANSTTRIKSFLTDGSNHLSHQLVNPLSECKSTHKLAEEQSMSPPVAELFPDTTVLFSDIDGFTAWSSVREPTQVFSFLETLYGAFDAIARRRGVFKAEAIGNSYVAVCGLPEPRADHAVVMTKFARDCRDKMNEITHALEKSLGPDTGDLKLRFGLSSGPVTAGVLRGDRLRFQLFGDTVNHAAKMENNGQANKIHVSQKTADLLRAAGKGRWLKEREEPVKGALQTYWVNPPSRARSEDEVLRILGRTISPNGMTTERVERLIDWNLEVFEGLVRRIVAKRIAMGGERQHSARNVFTERQGSGLNNNNNQSVTPMTDLTPIKPRAEILEVITLPEFEFNAKIARKESGEVELNPRVLRQLRDYISTIAYKYRANPFHNFEHASHVSQSIKKLLQRVVTPEVTCSTATTKIKKVAKQLASNLHSSTYGITSDPLTQFAIVFAALIHDVDHPGVSNGQLVVEKDPMALLFDNQSVAEQNSVAIAWELLMKPKYSDLRACLFINESELKRFRQLVVNSVMATDIFDKELKGFREARWDKSFHHHHPQNGCVGTAVASDSALDDELSPEELNRKATIVIEHLIQAADVAHTMQHWTVYQKWNKRLFHEMYKAFKANRSPANPANGWYKGELWFFDNYIIPLAKKLKECQVFGVSCDEFLDYALDNRREWEAKGEAIVEELLRELESSEHSSAAEMGHQQNHVPLQTQANNYTRPDPPESDDEWDLEDLPGDDEEILFEEDSVRVVNLMRGIDKSEEFTC